MTGGPAIILDRGNSSRGDTDPLGGRAPAQKVIGQYKPSFIWLPAVISRNQTPHKRPAPYIRGGIPKGATWEFRGGNSEARFVGCFRAGTPRILGEVKPGVPILWCWKLTLTVLGGLAEFERHLILSRTRRAGFAQKLAASSLVGSRS
jgi:hypothetical protein